LLNKKILALLKLNEGDLIRKFGNYTLEAIIIHTLCVIYSNCKNDVHTIRVACLIENLTKFFYMHASTLSKDKKKLYLMKRLTLLYLMNQLRKN
jgi:hypothetical protein